MNAKRVVFIHGRSQEDQDAAELKRTWLQAWSRGLEKSQHSFQADEHQVRFPYFGNALRDLVHGASAEEAARIVIRGAQSSAESASFFFDVLTGYIQELGITGQEIELATDLADLAVVQRGPQNWAWIQSVLRVIDSRSPGGAAMIALVTNDVHQYLTNPSIRLEIENGVLDAFDVDAENIVVSHSLGTIVAYTLLQRLSQDGKYSIPLLVTLGSPLGIRAIRKKLRPISHPTCVARWFNAFDPRDVVALNPLDKNHFGVTPEIENKIDVSNWTENRHGIAGYLDDSVVARIVHLSLLG